MKLHQLFAVLLATFAGTVMSADSPFVVADSNTPTYAPGTLFGTGDVLQLESGQTLTLFSEMGDVITVTGPHHGPVPGREPAGESLDLNAIAGLLLKRDSGSHALAATRGNASSPSYDIAMAITFDHPGKYCVHETIDHQIRWREYTRGVALVISEPATGDSYRLVWAVRGEFAPWPETLALKAGSRFHVQIGFDNEQRKFELVALDRRPRTDLHAIADLARHGCVQQAQSLVDQLLLQSQSDG